MEQKAEKELEKGWAINIKAHIQTVRQGFTLLTVSYPGCLQGQKTKTKTKTKQNKNKNKNKNKETKKQTKKPRPNTRKIA